MSRCGNGPAPAVTGGAAVPQSGDCTGSEWVGPRHQRGTAVEHYAGIDVSLERSSVCVVDATGRIIREAKVASEPEALVAFFGQLGLPLARVGLGAGPLARVGLGAGPLARAGLGAGPRARGGVGPGRLARVALGAGPLAGVGLEAGPLSQRLHAGLTAAGYE